MDFAGWEMPVQYTSIVAEHLATRTTAGVFDISHMGRLSLVGPGAEAFLDRIVTRRVTDMRPGQVRYALVTNEAGGILDDVLVYRIETLNSTAGMDWWSSMPAIEARSWTGSGGRGRRRVRVSRRHDGLGHDRRARPAGGRLACAATRRRAPIAQILPRPRDRAGRQSPFRSLVSRTGYTGEDGWELIVDAGLAAEIWSDSRSGPAAGALPAGLGARDTLRLEAAMPLYGHELSEEIDPYQAGLGFAVDLAGRTFPGRDASAKRKQQQGRPVRVGWELDGRRVPREGFAVLAGGQTVGHVTSGTFSPTLEKSIAMGYSRPEQSASGTLVAIDIRGRLEPARVVALPFYRRSSRGRNL